MVVHAKSNRKISYGDIAKTATVPNPLPEVTKADLKPASQFRLIGRDVGRVDVPSKVNGTAQYGIDVQLPGMLYAVGAVPASAVREGRADRRRGGQSRQRRGQDRAAAVRRRRDRRDDRSGDEGQGPAQGHLVEIDAGANL